MEQLATDLRDGTGKSSPGDLVEALKEALMAIFGTAEDSAAASGPVYDPASVKSIAEYGYDSEDYAPGWWMGYNTRDEVWMFSLSRDTRPDDTSR